MKTNSKIDKLTEQKIQEAAHLVRALGISNERYADAMKKWGNSAGRECVAILSDDTVMTEVAKDFDFGLTLDNDGQIAMCFHVETHDGTNVAAPISLDSAIHIIELAAAVIEAKHCAKTSGQMKRMEIAERLKSAFALVCNLDRTEELSKTMQQMYDADQLARFKALEERAEAAATKKVASQVRRMATALTTTDSVERHALIDDLAPFIRKAFEG